MIHTLQCESSWFNSVARGDKTFEVRHDDRDYQVGDTIRLIEHVDGSLNLNPKTLWLKIHYILRSQQVKHLDLLQDGVCILGIRLDQPPHHKTPRT